MQDCPIWVSIDESTDADVDDKRYYSVITYFYFFYYIKICSLVITILLLSVISLNEIIICDGKNYKSYCI
jgi:hypothetical protein